MSRDTITGSKCVHIEKENGERKGKAKEKKTKKGRQRKEEKDEER